MWETKGSNLKQESLQREGPLNSVHLSPHTMVSTCYIPRHHAKGDDIKIRYRLGVSISNVRVI